MLLPPSMESEDTEEMRYFVIDTLDKIVNIGLRVKDGEDISDDDVIDVCRSVSDSMKDLIDVDVRKYRRITVGLASIARHNDIADMYEEIFDGIAAHIQWAWEAQAKMLDMVENHPDLLDSNELAGCVAVIFEELARVMAQLMHCSRSGQLDGILAAIMSSSSEISNAIKDVLPDHALQYGSVIEEPNEFVSSTILESGGIHTPVAGCIRRVRAEGDEEVRLMFTHTVNVVVSVDGDKIVAEDNSFDIRAEGDTVKEARDLWHDIMYEKYLWAKDLPDDATKDDRVKAWAIKNMIKRIENE